MSVNLSAEAAQRFVRVLAAFKAIGTGEIQVTEWPESKARGAYKMIELRIDDMSTLNTTVWGPSIIATVLCTQAFLSMFEYAGNWCFRIHVSFYEEKQVVQ